MNTTMATRPLMKRTSSKICLTLDYHAHVLPGRAHGSDSEETSRKQLAMAAAARVRTVCAPPHFYPHKESLPSFLQRREASARLLRENLTADAPQLQLGAEVLICDGMERLDGLPHLCRSETNELLLEMPFYQWPEAIWDTLYALCERRDIKIVLAHAERYPPDASEQLIRDNVALQLNSECLTRPLHRKRYLTWIKNGSVKYLGSDIHMLGDGYRAWEKCVKLLGK